MARLGDVLGALVSQIEQGRSQADLATIEIARIYKEHPLLREFPIPKFTLDEAIVDLKMIVSAISTPEYFITPQIKSQILSEIDKLLADLPDKEPSVAELSKESPEFSNLWQLNRKEVSQRLDGFIPSERVVEPKLVAEGAASLIIGQLTKTVLARQAKIRVNLARSFMAGDTLQVEKGVASQIQNILENIFKSQSNVPDRLDVLVTASELENFPLEKITNVRLTLRESDRAWTQIETDSGEIIEKIIPY
jgi:hypothetical protein